MSDAKSQAEPTMEEILASIRRIISEEGEDPEATTVKVASQPEPPPEVFAAPEPPPPRREPTPPVDDVLTLTEMVGDDGSVTSLDAAAPPAWEPEPEPPPPPPPRPRVEAPPPPRPAPAPSSRLVSPSTAAMTTAAFGEISQRMGYRPGRGGGGRTVEELVEDVVRPMLQAWLDENLPSMVERLVAEEIQRLSGRGPDD